MVVTKMELQRLKEKLPNISIRYTGTWKDSLKFGVEMAATAIDLARDANQIYFLWKGQNQHEKCHCFI